MRDFTKIIVIFIILALMSLGIKACVQPIVNKMKAHYNERNPITEVVITQRKHFTICTKPEIGEKRLQEFVDCHTKSKGIYRTDI